MGRRVNLPAIEDKDYVLPIEAGGTDSKDLISAAIALDLVTNSMKGVANGAVGLNGVGKIDSTSLPSTGLAKAVNLVGNFRMVVGLTYSFKISDYDSFKTYTIVSTNGSFVRNGAYLTYTANQTVGSHTLTINGVIFPFIVQLPSPDMPTVTSPVLNGAIVTPTYLMTASPFIEFGDTATHQASDWQVATAPDFNTIVASTINDTVNKTSWNAVGLQDATTYYVRVRYKATNGNYGQWSNTSMFSVAIPVPVTPTITAPTANAVDFSVVPTITTNAFGALPDASTHVSSDWQISTLIDFSTIAKQSLVDTVNKVSWNSGLLSPLTSYYVRARHKSSNGKSSAWSTPVRFTTANVYGYNYVVSATMLNLNVGAMAIAAGWDGNLPLIADITINSGVVVGSNSIATYAFDTGASLPAGSMLTLVNNGMILGKGGNGNGGAGGSALRTVVPTSITNNGTIGGGGGAGGAGGGGYYQATTKGGGSYGGTSVGGGGGGGAGYQGGTGGPTQGTGSGPYTFYSSPSAGGAGTNTGGGGGGGGSYGHGGSVSPNTYTQGGSGGSGGGLGVPGGGGSIARWSGQNTGSGTVGGAVGGWTTTSSSPAPTVGGTAGKATVGNSNITWLTIGTRLGALT